MPTSSPFAALWPLDQTIDFLNHGSFGSCPREVLALQQELRDEMERQPVTFFARRYYDRLDAAREVLAGFVGCDAEGLVAIPNATTGVNAVLQSIAPHLAPGDELLTTDHAYNACRNALEVVAAATGARVVTARVPLPLAGAAELVAAVLAAVTPRTRLALLDHVTSPTAVVFPIERLVAALAERGVDTLVDGAHAPGMVELDLRAVGAAWYTGNCHKWLCAPKGAGFLWAREDRREALRPPLVSHGHNRRRPGRSQLHDDFDWLGTVEPTPFLLVPESLRVVGAMVAGGWPEVRRRNHELTVEARRVLLAAVGGTPLCPESMLGSMAAVALPPAPPGSPGVSPLGFDPLQERLFERHGVEVPIFGWPPTGERLVRVSAQLYNDASQYERLAAALGQERAISAGAGLAG
jgi:isopenicillin-N epimerase